MTTRRSAVGNQRVPGSPSKSLRKRRKPALFVSVMTIQSPPENPAISFGRGNRVAIIFGGVSATKKRSLCGSSRHCAKGRGGSHSLLAVQLLNAYFSLSRAAWTPCVIAWDPATGEFRRVEGPEGFTTWEEADEASGFRLRVQRPADPDDS